MVFRETSFTSLLFFVALGPLLIQSSQAQDGSRAFQSAIGLKAHGFTGNPARPGPFKPNPFAQSLSQRNHNFTAEPPRDLASELAEATLPATSTKKYPLPGLSGVNFLAPTKFQPMEFRSFSSSGLNTSKLRDTRLPDLSKAR
jgi:hypothetical protein